MDQSGGVDLRAVAGGRAKANPLRRGDGGFIEAGPESACHAQDADLARDVELHVQQYFTLNTFGSRLGCINGLRLRKNFDRSESRRRDRLLY